MPRDIDLEAELRREAMDRLIAASTGSAAAGREANLTSGISSAGNAAPGRVAKRDVNLA